MKSDIEKTPSVSENSLSSKVTEGVAPNLRDLGAINEHTKDNETKQLKSASKVEKPDVGTEKPGKRNLKLAGHTFTRHR
jgi:hypothetical protein